ncbi:hypothetical protein PR202_gb29347 [Eleusine coracana subsp. coracana]|uniref:Uncharacterized protein n=1 Tax=Eleusine coracana subsp. coracana TaxID=191504 RepID=A0AAV5FWU7_ELECO|nr:hypothetical protein QOZ80_9BG0706550 [Eleusine coracana subsp. coracana]GJN40168.1 hypothetical protein PR202_gb29347 [Eleusine coracana subsp. coracana]
MNRRLCILLFAATLLVVAFGVAKAAASSSVGPVAMPGLHALRRVEDDALMMSSFAEGEDEAAYPKRRVLQGGGHISYNTLGANKAACYGSCAARGQPYKPGCLQIYQCRG